MISNSSPLIILAKLNKIELLIKLFGHIEISESVYEEVTNCSNKSSKGEILLIEEHIKRENIKIKKLNADMQEKSAFLSRSFSKLDRGESDTIALALQEKERYVLMDEKIARKVAELYGILPIGALGILLLSYKKNIINEQEVKSIVDKFILHDFRVGAEVINEFWKIFEKIKKEHG